MEESPGVGLNLGCGSIRWPGWVNVDFSKGDLCCDLRALTLPDDHADVAVAVHVLEHFYEWEAVPMLAEWRRVLKPGGKLVLELPCMDKVLKYLYACVRENLPLSPSMGWYVFWGDPTHKDPFMCHKWGYTRAMLKQALEAAGFRDVTFEPTRYHFDIRDMRAVAWK